ncbi:MAG: HAMP domain-containing protein [Planctomycetes bacterium]|nr:HAMP domain-containing protein [Planctomycetota bacterium]
MESNRGRAEAQRSGAWFSIERQLPLLVGLLLAPAVALLVVWSYVDLRRTSVDAAAQRMASGAREIATLFALSNEQRVAEVRRLATLAALRDALRYADPPIEAAARAALEASLRGGTTPGRAELWTIDGSCVLAAAPPASAAERADPPAPPETAGMLPLARIGDAIEVAAAAEIFAADDPRQLLGHVVLRRVLSGNRPAVELLGGLIGSAPSLALGNRDGSVWCDLERPIEPPTADPLAAPGRLHRGADGSDRVGAGVAVPGAPWVLWVDAAAAPVLAPARSTALRMATASAVLLALCMAGAWFASRRITRPLVAATAAAEAIAAGRLDQRLALRTPTELRRLAESFNTMTERVDQSRQELEARVEARTADLKSALGQLREAQESLLRKERLATLGQLAGGVGHELRNPLGVMTNAIYYLELILEQAPTEVIEYLGILRHQIGLSEKIISDLLDFARARPPQALPVRLDALVDQQIARLGPFSGTIERAIPADLAPAFADPVQIGQVVFNLLTNATQAMGEPGGTLRVAGREEPDGRVRIEVTDSGAGVPAELAERIFEPLFTTRARGIGLGLAVSRRLAEQNGGELRLEAPRAGAGATFTLLLPTAARAAIAATADPAALERR